MSYDLEKSSVVLIQEAIRERESLRLILNFVGTNLKVLTAILQEFLKAYMHKRIDFLLLRKLMLTYRLLNEPT